MKRLHFAILSKLIDCYLTEGIIVLLYTWANIGRSVRRYVGTISGSPAGSLSEISSSGFSISDEMMDASADEETGTIHSPITRKKNRGHKHLLDFIMRIFFKNLAYDTWYVWHLDMHNCVLQTLSHKSTCFLSWGMSRCSLSSPLLPKMRKILKPVWYITTSTLQILDQCKLSFLRYYFHKILATWPFLSPDDI